MRAPRAGWIGMWLLAVAAWPVAAQPIAPPTTPTGGLFGARRSGAAGAAGPELALSLILGTGYDQDPETTDGSGFPFLVSDQSGTIGTGAANLSYRTGSAENSFELQGGGYLNHASEGVYRIFGADATAQATAAMGRRAGLTARVNSAYQPTFLFNAYGPITGQVENDLPNSGPSQGITDQQWVSSQGTIMFRRNWSPRQVGNAQYTYSQRHPVSDGPGFDSWSQAAGYSHVWNPSLSLSVRPTYRFSQNRQRDETGIELPLDSHSVAMELTYTRRLSPERMYALTAGAGYTRSSYELPTETRYFNLPTFSGGARINVARDWTVAADAARDVTVLEGLSPEPFATNAFSFRADGLAGRRTQIVLSSGYSKGGGLASQNGSFETIVGTAQVQIALGRVWAVYTGFSHYRYRLGGVTTGPVGLPSRYQLNSFRVGLNLWFPLYGRF